MTELSGYVSAILTNAGTLISSLFTAGGETPAVINAVAALPIVSGIIGVAVSASRKSKG